MNHLFASYQRNNAIGDGNNFTARPLKHYRKQYTEGLTYSRASVGMPMDRPGGLVPVATEEIHCATCSGALAAKVQVFKDSACTSCNPIQRRMSPLPTYLNSSAYLQSRCRTYDQKLSTEPNATSQYFSEAGLPSEPSASPTGSQVRESVNCFNTRDPLICDTTIYKPNNNQFAQQGSVSSSSRIARLKYNTLNNLSISNTAAGAEGINSGRYRTEPSDYFTKYKAQSQTVPFPQKSGKKTHCCSSTV